MRFDDISIIKHDQVNGRGVLLRLIESIGYRLHRATLGLTADHMETAPVPDAMTLREQIRHVGRLVQSAIKVFGDWEGEFENWSLDEVFDGIARLYETVEALDDAKLAACTVFDGASVLYMVNGPLSDALWHIGQISTYKKLLGVPASPGGYFKGEKC